MSKSSPCSLLPLAVAVAVLSSCNRSPSSAPGSGQATTPVATPAGPKASPLPTLEANQSVVVVKDVGFGTRPPVLADVVRDLERLSQPEDGRGRTFAILEVFTQPDPASSNLNLCLRISTEKPGTGEIIYRPTRTSLWKNQVTPATHAASFTGGALTVLFDNGDGKTFTVDGSTGPPSIFEALLKETGTLVGQMWPDGELRELMFIYSACGCPIHVKCRREGDRTVRTEQATQFIFPDDPAAVQVISQLMRW